MHKLAYFVLAAAFLGAGCNSAQTTSQSDTTMAPQPQTSVEQPAPTSGADEAPAEPSTYTLDDVSKHATAEDCWMAVDGKVYDVTGAVEGHPGGPAILKGCGKDSTEMFKGVEKHGEKASGFLQTLQIGVLK